MSLYSSSEKKESILLNNFISKVVFWTNGIVNRMEVFLCVCTHKYMKCGVSYK